MVESKTTALEFYRNPVRDGYWYLPVLIGVGGLVGSITFLDGIPLAIWATASLGICLLAAPIFVFEARTVRVIIYPATQQIRFLDDGNSTTLDSSDILEIQKTSEIYGIGPWNREIRILLIDVQGRDFLIDRRVRHSDQLVTIIQQIYENRNRR